MNLTKQQKIMVSVLVVAAFVVVLNQTIVNPAVPAVIREMRVDADTAAWVVTGFTMVTAVMVPVTGYLTDRFATRSLFIAAMLSFLSGSALAGWSPNFAALMGGRVLQAMGAGVIMPLVTTVMMLTFPLERRGTAMGIFGLVIAFAPAIGPTVGGIVIDAGNFHLLFFGITLLAALLLLGAPFISTATTGGRENPKLDVLSVVLSTLGLGGMLYGVSTLSSGRFTWVDAVIIAGGVAAIVWFVHRQLTIETPLLQLSVFRSHRFAISAVIMVLVQASLMAAVVLIPLYIQNMRGMSATTSGLIIMPGAILMGAMGPFVGVLFDRHGARRLSIFGTALLTIGTGALMFLGDTTSTVYITVFFVIRMFGLAFINMPINTWGINSLDNRVINHGNSVATTMRMVSGSIGVALLISVMSSVARVRERAGVDGIHAQIAGVNAAFIVATLFGAAAFVLALAWVHDGPASPNPHDDAALASDTPSDDDRPGNTPIPEDVLRRDVYAIHEDATVADAVRLLTARQISSMPIVDADGHPLGIISEAHVVRALGNRSQVTFYDPVNALVGSGLNRSDFRSRVNRVMAMNVRALCSTTVITAPEGTSMEEASRLLADNKLHKLYLVDASGKLTAALNRSDLVHFALGLAENSAHADDEAAPRPTEAHE